MHHTLAHSEARNPCFLSERFLSERFLSERFLSERSYQTVAMELIHIH
jgi:hypothetical protein